MTAAPHVPAPLTDTPGTGSPGPARRSVTRRRAAGLVLVALLGIGVAIILGFGFGRNPGYVPSALVGRAAPPLAGRTLTGGGWALNLERGHPVLVNFWASWCPTCRAEQSLLNTLASQLTPRGLRVIGVDMSDTTASADAFLAEFGGARYPSLVDPQAELAASWGVFGIPETYLVSPEGRVLAKATGELTPAWIDQQVLPTVNR